LKKDTSKKDNEDPLFDSKGEFYWNLVNIAIFVIAAVFAAVLFIEFLFSN
jgi:hypothetical protein